MWTITPRNQHSYVYRGASLISLLKSTLQEQGRETAESISVHPSLELHSATQSMCKPFSCKVILLVCDFNHTLSRKYVWMSPQSNFLKWSNESKLQVVTCIICLCGHAHSRNMGIKHAYLQPMGCMFNDVNQHSIQNRLFNR